MTSIFKFFSFLSQPHALGKMYVFSPVKQKDEHILNEEVGCLDVLDKSSSKPYIFRVHDLTLKDKT